MWKLTSYIFSYKQKIESEQIAFLITAVHEKDCIPLYFTFLDCESYSAQNIENRVYLFLPVKKIYSLSIVTEAARKME